MNLLLTVFMKINFYNIYINYILFNKIFYFICY